MIATNGVTLQVTEAGDAGAPVVVLLHGFPELAYTWRHQIPALAAAGYHVVAPDQRGYGGSSAPAEVDAYTVADLSADVVGLLDEVGAEKAVLVGHDFGGVVAWGAPLLHPDRVAGVVGISFPPVPRPRVPTTQAFRRLFGDEFFYILYFQDVGPADRELAADPATTLRKIMAADLTAPSSVPNPTGFLDRIADPGHLPPWLSAAEFEHYVTAFARSGFTGPLNWYRCFDRNWELTASPPAAAITAPALFIGGHEDPTLAYTPRDRVRDIVTGEYREVLLDGGHWLPEERPADVTATLLEFLGTLEWP
ncbi:alpha/beta hydrolase [Mycolicibacterium arenosum]|uniref:Alpha/beta hydrolase n=1 Tax=Mycolicibacterium arenosum TaxID=2952157 RepID=A0ABT1M8U0_9MYCO|nr:alpha/beta hydrolase [Mycolicibacterium sp. CAU 1645]MCP9275604.1 alpha/beta hydrolase [Mycolicibacterium sp. CAU 1645]